MAKLAKSQVGPAVLVLVFTSLVVLNAKVFAPKDGTTQHLCITVDSFAFAVSSELELQLQWLYRVEGFFSLSMAVHMAFWWIAQQQFESILKPGLPDEVPSVLPEVKAVICLNKKNTVKNKKKLNLNDAIPCLMNPISWCQSAFDVPHRLCFASLSHSCRGGCGALVWGLGLDDLGKPGWMPGGRGGVWALALEKYFFFCGWNWWFSFGHFSGLQYFPREIHGWN